MVVLAGATAAVVVELTGGEGQALPQVLPDSVGVIDPGANRVVGQVPLPGRPSLVTVDERSVWVASEARTLSAISPKTLLVTDVVPLNLDPSDLAADEAGAVWILDAWRRLLVKVDSTYGKLDGRIPLPPVPPSRRDERAWQVTIDARDGELWVTDGSTGLLRLDPATGAVRKEVDLEAPLNDVAVGGNAVWAISGAAATVFRVSPQGTVRDRIPIASRTGLTAPFPFAVAVGEGAVWVLNGNTATVTRIDPQVGGVVATIPLGAVRNSSAIAVGAGAAWVVNSGDGTLSRIDPETNTVSSMQCRQHPRRGRHREGQGLDDGPARLRGQARDAGEYEERRRSARRPTHRILLARLLRGQRQARRLDRLRPALPGRPDQPCSDFSGE